MYILCTHDHPFVFIYELYSILNIIVHFNLMIIIVTMCPFCSAEHRKVRRPVPPLPPPPNDSYNYAYIYFI